MVAIAAEEVGGVADVPFIPEAGVAVAVNLAFAGLPFVEGLVHDEEAHSVAEVEKFRGGRVVGRADGVAAHGAEEFEAALPHAQGDGGADGSGFVVEADAVDFDVFAVEEEAAVGVEGGFADAEGGVVDVGENACGADGGAKGVESGSGKAPALGLGDGKFLGEFVGVAGGDGLGGFGGVDGVAVCVLLFVCRGWLYYVV